jgi:hypothetical protein
MLIVLLTHLSALIFPLLHVISTFTFHFPFIFHLSWYLSTFSSVFQIFPKKPIRGGCGISRNIDIDPLTLFREEGSSRGFLPPAFSAGAAGDAAEAPAAPLAPLTVSLHRHCHKDSPIKPQELSPIVSLTKNINYLQQFYI